MAKKIIGVLLFIALLPATAFNVLLVCVTFTSTEYLKALVIFLPTLFLLLWFQRLFWKMFRGQKPEEATTEKGAQVIRCQCCGGSNTVFGNRAGTCQYCYGKLRFSDRI